MKLVCVSDAAFKRVDPSGLACRGMVISLISGLDKSFPGGDLQVLDFASKKQKRVARSTFAAELHSVADSLETAKLISLTLQEMIGGPQTSTELATLEEGISSRKWTVPIHACIDAYSVHSAICATNTKTPTEASLQIIVQAIREGLDRGRLEALWWVYTHDMLADGLTKGSINRRALLEAFRDGKWHINGTNENKPKSYWSPKLHNDQKHGIKMLIAKFEGHITSKSTLPLSVCHSIELH